MVSIQVCTGKKGTAGTVPQLSDRYDCVDVIVLCDIQYHLSCAFDVVVLLSTRECLHAQRKTILLSRTTLILGSGYVTSVSCSAKGSVKPVAQISSCLPACLSIFGSIDCCSSDLGDGVLEAVERGR